MLNDHKNVSAESPSAQARSVNEEYYNVIREGMLEYWNKMAAPLYRSRVIISELKKAKVSSVFDIGCGCGQLLSRIGIKLGSAKLAGMDLSSAQIQLGKNGMPFIDWYVQDVERPDAIPTQLHGKFDSAVSSELIEHIENPNNVFECANVLLKPNGLLIISTQGGKVYDTEKKIGHLRHFTKKDLKELFIRNGYESVRTWSAGWPFHAVSKMLANIDPATTMKKFSTKQYGAFENFACLVTRFAYIFNLPFAGTQIFGVGRKR